MSKLNPFGITHSRASEAILKTIREGRLIQKEWHSKASDGRDLACLLGSMHPGITEASQCNGDLMPLWMAELTVTLFDGLPPSQVPDIGTRYGTLVGMWGVLSPEAWARVETGFRVQCIREALDAARPGSQDLACWATVEGACEAVIQALRGTGDLTKAQKAAAGAAGAAAGAAARTAWAAEAAGAAGWAAEAAGWAAGAAAGWAAEAAAGAAAGYAGWATREGMYLRFFTFLLDLIEQELRKIN